VQGLSNKSPFSLRSSFLPPDYWRTIRRCFEADVVRLGSHVSPVFPPLILSPLRVLDLDGFLKRCFSCACRTPIRASLNGFSVPPLGLPLGGNRVALPGLFPDISRNGLPVFGAPVRLSSFVPPLVEKRDTLRVIGKPKIWPLFPPPGADANLRFLLLRIMPLFL